MDLNTPNLTQYKVQVSAQTIFLEEYSKPSSSEYLYCYKINITNNGPETVQLLNRHWIIIDGNGRREDVNGAGVIGQQPKLAPGESHEYYSFCNLETNFGTMEGEYEFVDNEGNFFLVPIPRFFLAENLFQFPKAQFHRGQIIQHQEEDFKAIVVDYDMYFINDEELYNKNPNQPAKDAPWYYVLIDNTNAIGYFPQEALVALENDEDINHPLVDFFFDEKGKEYKRNNKSWEDLKQS